MLIGFTQFLASRTDVIIYTITSTNDVVCVVAPDFIVLLGGNTFAGFVNEYLFLAYPSNNTMVVLITKSIELEGNGCTSVKVQHANFAIREAQNDI